MSGHPHASQHNESHFWLGEHHTNTVVGKAGQETQCLVRNTEKNLNKPANAMKRLEEASSSTGTVQAQITRRQVVALIGLIVWMSHTIGIKLNEL
jgi:hypothetical protein